MNPRILTADEAHLVPSAEDHPEVVATDPECILPRRIQWWAESEPNRPFLVEVTGRSASFGDFLLTVRRWITLLRSLGVERGDCVESMLPSSIDAHAFWLAAGWMGAVEVPINHELRGQFLDHALRDSGARLCFVRPDHAAVLTASPVEMEVVEVPRDGSLVERLEPADLGPMPAPGDTSCVIYTSGTTGPSKGVVISWAQMAATIGRIPRSCLGPTDAVYSCHPMFHVTGRSPLPSMADVGGRVVLRERFSGTEFWADVHRFSCTSATVNPALLLGAPERPDDADNPLRVCLTGGSRAQVDRFAARFGTQMVECYGSTEVGFPLVLREAPTDGQSSCGFLRRGYEARLIDDEGNDVPDGEPGGLLIRPPHRLLITTGYLGQPDLTAKAIVDGWYHTGDRLVRRPDGSFRFVDRARDTIRRMGENISSVALETAVVDDAAVLECVALPVPDPVAGHEVLLVIIPHPDVEFDPAALHARLATVLPRYMVPRYIVAREDLPRTPTNKVLKAGLLNQIDLASAWEAP